VIAAPAPDERWAYRRGAITAVTDAVVAMIREKAGANQATGRTAGQAAG
jgi:hypothetical protein